jgi:hypothetical protein
MPFDFGHGDLVYRGPPGIAKEGVDPFPCDLKLALLEFESQPDLDLILACGCGSMIEEVVWLIEVRLHFAVQGEVHSVQKG